MKKELWLLLIPVKIWLYKFLKAEFPELLGKLLTIPWRGKNMDAKQGLGTIGQAEESLVGGVLKLQVSVEIDLAGELQKKVNSMADGWQKAALSLAITALKNLG